MKLLKKASDFMIETLENAFYRWGKTVATYPAAVILVSLLISGLCSLGFLRFRHEVNANKLWIPEDSAFNIHEAWLEENFKKNRRWNLAIFTADNVLTPTSLQQMFELHRAVANISINGSNFETICTRLPIADIFHSKTAGRRRRRGLPRRTREALVTEDTNLTAVEDAVYNEEDYESLWGDYDYDYEVKVKVDEERKKTRINFAKFGKNRDKKKNLDVDLPDDIYCDLVKYLEGVCLQGNLLDIWRYDEKLIYSTTTQEILDAVNLLDRSPWLSYQLNYTSLLGGKVYNSTGHVVGAKAAQLYWSTTLPENILQHVLEEAGGIEVDQADPLTMAWEKQFIDTVLGFSFEGVKIYVNANRSFGDISGQAVLVDGIKMVIGYFLMFAYTIVMLGRMTVIGIKLYLAVIGLVLIGLGICVGLGLTLAFGFPFTPLHGALPFLALGIGIDDMFVVVQYWVNMERTDGFSELPFSERTGLTMKHAGVAITITTLTDVFAFGIGSITKMPGLESFCIATAVSLATIYLLVISCFIAFLYLDERRIDDDRNGFFPCIKHKVQSENALSRFDIGEKFFKLYAVLLDSKVYKTLVLLLTLVFLGLGIYGSVNIRQKFSPTLILPMDSYLRKFLSVHNELYPSNGWVAEMFFGAINHTHLEGLDQLTAGLHQLVANKQHIREVKTWWDPLKDFAATKRNFSNWEDFANPVDFPNLLGDFLYSYEGANFKGDFKWVGKLECRQPAPPISATKFEIAYFVLDGPEEHIPARRAISQLLEETNLSTTVFTHVKIYAAWETDEIIGFEMWRNVGISLSCVMIITVLLLVNTAISFYVFICVVFTLADLVGFLHFWDMTIDIVTCINIVLAIGLCVDYTVHIGHAYLVAEGSRVEKAMSAVRSIGPAVLNGGITTFLALTPLGFSESQLFLTFFKVFLLTVVFGLWHGLIILPVLLSLVGPTSSEHGQPSETPQDPASKPVDHLNQAFQPDVGEDLGTKTRMRSLFPSKGSWSPGASI